MPKISFQGFATGSTVDIDGTSVPAWGVVNDTPVWDFAQANSDVGVTVTINKEEGDYNVSPKSVLFSVTVAGFDTNSNVGQFYDPSYHDKKVYWDYGESYTYTANPAIISADAADGGIRSNSRYSHGPLGSHTYRGVATHTVRVAVFEPFSGKWGYATTTVTVEDFDTFFGTDIIYVNTTGVYTNAPVGSTNFDNIDAALDAHNNRTTPTAVMLENGQTFTMGSSHTYRTFGSANTMLFIRARDLGGVRPLINDSAITTHYFSDQGKASSTGSTGFTFQCVNLEGRWDVTNQTGQQTTLIERGFNGGSRMLTLDRCNLGKMEVGVDFLSDNGITDIVSLNDSYFYDWGNFGILSQANSEDQISVTGSGFIQNIDAEPGGPSSSLDTNNRHGPMRLARPGSFRMQATDLFSSTGWSSWGSGQAIQPCLRLFSGWANNSVPDGKRACITDCLMESFYICAEISSQNGSTPANVHNILLESNLLMTGSQGRTVVAVNHTGITLRNNTLVFSSSARTLGTISQTQLDTQAFVQAVFNTPRTSHEGEPIVIEDNTFINLSDDPAAVDWDVVAGTYTDVTRQRNLIHQPTAPVPETTYAPLSTTILATPRWKGYRDNSGTLFAQFVAGANDLQTLTPVSPSTALNGSGEQIIGAADFNEDYIV